MCLHKTQPNKGNIKSTKDYRLKHRKWSYVNEKNSNYYDISFVKYDFIL